jgi:hypothetical protein
VSIFFFLKAFAQNDGSSRIDGAYSIRSISHQNLPMPTSEHNGAEKHHRQ